VINLNTVVQWRFADAVVDAYIYYTAYSFHHHRLPYGW